MGIAEQLPLLTDNDLRSLMADASQLLLDPAVEPLARALNHALGNKAGQPADRVIALTLLAAAAGAVGANRFAWREALAVQQRITELVFNEHCQAQPAPTVH
jgi:hypothetical protein